MAQYQDSSGNDYWVPDDPAPSAQAPPEPSLDPTGGSANNGGGITISDPKPDPSTTIAPNPPPSTQPPPSVDRTPPAPAAPGIGAMPPGMDPRIWALYQKYGITPGGPGSGPTDWQYYQRRAGEVGDWNYMLNRLEGDLSGGKSGISNSPEGAGLGAQGFADPAYQGLMDLVTKRLAALNQPQSFPQMDQLMAMLQQNQAAARARAQTFATQLGGRVQQLQQPLLTDANVVNQRALASNNLLKARDSTIQNMKDRRYAAGFEPTSGLIAGDERAANESYSNAQSNTDAQLQSMSIAQDENRRNQATTLQGLIQQALQGGDVTALSDQARQADLENQAFNIDQNRQREQLTVGNIPVDLTNMGFANANQVANSGGDPLSALLPILLAGNTQQGLQQNASNGNMSALTWLLQTLFSGH